MVIERVSDADLARDCGEPDAYNLMQAIYSQARRTALGTDAAIDALLQAMEEDEPGRKGL